MYGSKSGWRADSAAKGPSSGDKLAELRELVGDGYGPLIRKFIEKTDTTLSDGAADLIPGDRLPAFIREIHSLKSSSRYMGAADIGEAAEEIEKKARNLTNGGDGLAELQAMLLALKGLWQSVRPVYENEIRKYST